MTDIRVLRSLGGAVRSSLSGHHLYSSAFFAKISGAIEDDGLGKTAAENRETTHQHMSYSINSVLASVAFLEAEINTLFADSEEAQHGYNRIHGLSADELKLLSAVWGVESVQRASILGKYQTALKVCGKPTFDTGTQTYQDTRLLIEVRNALVHFVPATWAVDTAGVLIEEKHPLPKLARGLKDKFPLSPFAPDMITMPVAANGEPIESMAHTIPSPFFPDTCLGYGCALWGFKTVLCFADEFFGRLNAKGSYEYVRRQLPIE